MWRPVACDLGHIAPKTSGSRLKTIFKNDTAVGMARTLADVALGQSARVARVEGARAFRRRLLEMGLVPGTEVRVVTVAPLGDPLRIEVRGGQWSVRRNEAAQIVVHAP
jgi:ferrous iron transport protein A